MSEKKRFYKFLDDKQEWVIRNRTNRRQEYRVGRNKGYTEKLVDLLNELNDERMMYKTTIDKRIVELEEENEQLKKYYTVLKNQIKKMGEIGGFNKHMIKTILESNYDD